MSLERITLSSPSGASCEVALFGGHVLSWKSHGGARENLFLSPLAALDGSKAIRGGVPVIFPQFGPGEMVKHGFARTARWRVHARDGDAKITLALAEGDLASVPESWKGVRFELLLVVELVADDQLRLDLVVSNTGDADFRFQGGLHPYFSVGDLAAVAVDGLEGQKFADKVGGGDGHVQRDALVTFQNEHDRVYAHPAAPVLVKLGASKAVKIETTGYDSIVTWNPGEAKGLPMGDLGAHWPHFVCVEPFYLWGQPLAPSAKFRAGCILSAL